LELEKAAEHGAQHGVKIKKMWQSADGYDTSISVDVPITASNAQPAASVPADTPPPPGQVAITITLANGTRLEISAALSLPALSCIIGALR
jgi:hypothetical protein